MQNNVLQSCRSIITFVVISEKDSPSPQAFIIWLDTLLRRGNVNLSHRAASLFLDKVLLVSRARYHIQEIVEPVKNRLQK